VLVLNAVVKEASVEEADIVKRVDCEDELWDEDWTMLFCDVGVLETEVDST